MGSFCAQLFHATRATIVGGESEEHLVEVIHRLVAVILDDHEVEVFDPGLNVCVFLVDVANFHYFACGWHELHDPMAPT